MNRYLVIVIIIFTIFLVTCIANGSLSSSCAFEHCRTCTSETVVCDGNKVCPKDLPNTVVTLSLSGAFGCGSDIDQDLLANLVNLRTLFLTNAIYGTITASSFAKNPDLENIILTSNSILSVDEKAFNGLDKVADINLMDNELETLDTNVFNHLSSLRILNLNTNKLTNITKGMFGGLKHLTSLQLKKNRINVLEPGAFEGSKISYLSLVDNPITHFEPGVFMNAEIGVLDLSGTRLTSLPHDLLKSVDTLFLAGLTNWTCDCNALPLLEHLEVHERTSLPECREPNLSLQDVGVLLRELCGVKTTTTVENTTTTTMDPTTALMMINTTNEFDNTTSNSTDGAANINTKADFFLLVQSLMVVNLVLLAV